MLREDTPRWQYSPEEAYVPLLHDGEVVGFCKPEYARRITLLLNEESIARRALKLACIDLVKLKNAAPEKASPLMKHYLKRVERPKAGTPAIAMMLRERQEELDVSDDEFARFCDSYRLSREQLLDIYASLEIPDDWLDPLSRILGVSLERLVQIRDRNISQH